MHSIILTKESHTAQHLARFEEKLKSLDFYPDVLVKVQKHDYSGFVITAKMEAGEISEIKKLIMSLPEQSTIHFQEGVPAQPGELKPRSFNFEDYDDTDVSAYRVEITIDEALQNMAVEVRDNIKNLVTRGEAVEKIADIWVGKIREWKKNGEILKDC